MNKPSRIIRTPDYRLRVFVSSTLRELVSEREAAQVAIRGLRLAPVMFELGARPHPASDLYRAYLDQSHIFLGIYWQSYGWIAPDMKVSGLEDEYLLAKDKPKLIYIKSPAPDREQKLTALLDRIKSDDAVSYKYFSTTEELRESIENDLTVMLAERFELSELRPDSAIAVVEAPRHNLPAQVTSFVGREGEIESILTIFRRDDARLLTLTGPGGTGKTRLALQVAERLMTDYKNGVWFIELAETNESDLVISKIAQILGVREGGTLSLLESLKGYLRDQQILLLLDNFEQVLVAAPIVAELLEVAQGLSVLITSRSLLNLRGEFEFPVPPLKLPEGPTNQDLESLIQCESVKMFLDRATAANPRFVINNSNATLIREICQRLDGLPLALELAAAKIKLLSPEIMSSMLSSRLELLTGGARDLPERQQTLRNTLEWSINLLEEKVKNLFAQLGVFVGGFTIEAVEAVCNFKEETDSNLDTFEALSTLLNNSLIQMEGPHSLEPRFKMLETIREFALELLEESGEKDTIIEQHGQYFANKIVVVNSKYSSRESDYWLDWTQSEHDNLRAALAWCLSNSDTHLLAPWLISSMIWFWYRRGFLIEGRDWCNRLLESPIVMQNLEARGLALFSSGAMAMWQGDLKNASSFLEDAVKIAEKVGDPFLTGYVLLFKGTALVNCAEDELALQPLEESLTLFTQLEMQYYQATTMVHLGNAMLGLGDQSKARSYLEQAHSLSLEVGDKWLISLVLNNYGEVARVQGDYQLAKESYVESESLLREMGDKGDLARLVHNLGIIDLHLGNIQKAETQFVESLMMFRKLNNQRGMSECLAALAGLWTERGQLKSATELLSLAESHLIATGATWWPADRVEFEKNVKVLRNALGQDEFERFWNSGQGMKLEEALALVMETNNLAS